MSRVARSLTVLLLPLLCGACGYTVREVADPPEISLDQALTEVSDSLNDLQTRTQDRRKVGLMVDEVQVVFNVSAKATDTGKLGVSAAAVPIPIGGTLGVTADRTLVSEANRGNQITVKFKHVLTADMSKSKFVAQCEGPKQPSWCNAVLFNRTTD